MTIFKLVNLTRFILKLLSLNNIFKVITVYSEILFLTFLIKKFLIFKDYHNMERI